MKRPLSLTIIGWLSILVGAVCFLFLLFVALYADSGSSSGWSGRFRGSGLFIGGTVAALAGGVGLLKGLAWGRGLVLACAVLLLVDPLDKGATAIIGYGLLLAVCGYFLFRPQASAYFRGGGIVGKE